MRNEGVDHDEGVRELCVDRRDDPRPVVAGHPFGMCGRPTPQAGTQLDDFHLGKT